jgi:hypothetical protein
MRSRLEEAETTLERVFEEAMRALGPNQSLTQEIGRDLTSIYDKLGKTEEVMQTYERLKLGLNPQ